MQLILVKFAEVVSDEAAVLEDLLPGVFVDYRQPWPDDEEKCSIFEVKLTEDPLLSIENACGKLEADDRIEWARDEHFHDQFGESP